MNEFYELLNNLLLTSSTKRKVNLIKIYFDKSEIDEKAWAFAILSNRLNRKYLTSSDLKELVKIKIDEELFKYSYDYVGDLAETISLLWKNDNKEIKNFKLSKFMISLKNIQNKTELKNYINQILNQSSENQRYCILKILTGCLRVGVSNGLIKEALIKYGSRSSDEIDQLWYGFRSPFNDLFNWLDGEKLPSYIDKKKLFHSFMLANNFKYEDFKKEDCNQFLAEFKWDGIRAQIIFSKDGKIFSRNGDDITQSFPDINTYENNYFILDGELVVKKDNKILSFNELQKRIGRKIPSKKLIQEYPVHFISYDILNYKGRDLKSLKLLERKHFLKKFINYKKLSNISFSDLINFSNWDDLKNIRENSFSNHIEGVIIKNKSSIYQKGRVINGWYKWKRNPFSIDLIIMYAQRGHGKRSSFYSDFTLGCWVDNNSNKLVPITKAYSGYSNDELKKLDFWIRGNTLERFGPVRSVKPGLVVEISFDNINHSSRHKSGVALRFPRFSRIRWDKPISEVSVLKDIKNLIN